MSESQTRKGEPTPQTILRKVRGGKCNERPFGRTTYRELLEGLVATSHVDQEKAHKALFEGALAMRAQGVLAAVWDGRYYFPNHGGPAGTRTYGAELFRLVAAGKVRRRDAEDAVYYGNQKRADLVLAQIRYGQHDTCNAAGETYSQELLRLVRLGAVAGREASRAMRAGYRMRAVDALERASEGRCDEYSPCRLTYREELDYLVRLGYVDQERAHTALCDGDAHITQRRREYGEFVLRRVSDGKGFLSHAGDDTFAGILRKLVAEGIVDHEDAALASVEGSRALESDCISRKKNILWAVAGGKEDAVDVNSGATYSDELAILLASGAVSQHDANEARLKGIFANLRIKKESEETD